MKNIKISLCSIATAILLLSTSIATRAYDAASVTGIVRDPSGAVVTNAAVSLLNAQQAIIGTAITNAEGRFVIADVPAGSYLLVVGFEGFTERRIQVRVGGPEQNSLEVVLEPRAASEEVTVTANLGNVESIETISQQVNVISEREIAERARTVVAEVAQEEVGAHLQRTSPTISGIVVRGVTGNKVNVFVDGVRYSTSAQRGGISTFMNLIHPSNLQTIEVLRGPNSAQYGSDAIGGSIQVISRTPIYSPNGKNLHGQMGVFFNSADLSYGSNLTTSFATRRFGLLMNVAGSRVNTLRTGGGIDSHNAVTRFFGISSDFAIDGRLPDTAFTQYGGLAKMIFSPAEGSNIIASYTRGQQDGGKRYDQLLGGDGNLIADLRNLMSDVFYLRYDRVGAGWLNGVTLTYSFNTQREERVNQGGNGNPRSSINHEYERINVHGFQGHANKLIGSSQNILFGADYYHERINSPAFGVSPVSGAFTTRRPRIPDNALYRTGGIYVQDVWEAIPNRLRVMGNARYGGASYRVREEDAPIVDGRRLWPDDSLRVSSFTFRAGVVVIPVEGLSLLANIGRGFRAPHMTDLGALGLVGTGFEVSSSEVAGLNAMVGSSADEEAVSSGQNVSQLEPETNMNYEVGARYFGKRFDTDVAFFVNDIRDNIVKQSLILPPGAVGLRLGSETIVAQTATGVVFVDVSTSPVLVRANFGRNRIYGFEHTARVRFNDDWSAETIYTYLHVQDKNGTPAPDGWLKLRYAPVGRRFWIEPYIHAADEQTRLSSIDLGDRRTGATRSRSSIAAFFLNGATVRGLVNAGPDNTFGTADDFLKATGETLGQIQRRVLGPTLEASPLFQEVPGYVAFNIRGGIRLGESHDLLIDFQNITDRNYRGVDWGVDAPGRGVYVRFNTRF